MRRRWRQFGRIVESYRRTLDGPRHVEHADERCVADHESMWIVEETAADDKMTGGV
jgi:hypothetical protein